MEGFATQQSVHDTSSPKVRSQQGGTAPATPRDVKEPNYGEGMSANLQQTTRTPTVLAFEQKKQTNY